MSVNSAEKFPRPVLPSPPFRVKSSNDAAFLAAFFLVIGSVVTYLTLPGDPRPAGATALPAAVLAIALLAGPVVDGWTNGWVHMFRTEHLLLSGLVYWLLLDLIQGLYPLEVSNEAVVAAFAAMVLFAFGIILGTLLPVIAPPAAIRRLASMRIGQAEVFLAANICFVLGMFYFAWSSGFSLPTMVEGLLQSRFSSPWSRGAIGGWDSFIEHLTYFGYLLPTLAVMLFLQGRSGTNGRLIITLGLTAVVVLFLIQTGSRRTTGAALGAGILTWLWTRRATIRFRALVGAGIAALLVIGLLNFMLVNRTRGLSRGSDSRGVVNAVRVDDNFLRLCQVIQAIPERTPYVGVDWLVYVAVRPIPRALWPGKPTSPGFGLADYLGERGVSLTCSVLGEWYAAFGWVGILFGGILTGFLARSWSQLLQFRLTAMGAATYAWGTMALFVGLRSLIDLVLLSYVILALLALRVILVGIAAERRPGPS